MRFLCPGVISVYVIVGLIDGDKDNIIIAKCWEEMFIMYYKCNKYIILFIWLECLYIQSFGLLALLYKAVDSDFRWYFIIIVFS